MLLSRRKKDGMPQDDYFHKPRICDCLYSFTLLNWLKKEVTPGKHSMKQSQRKDGSVNSLFKMQEKSGGNLRDMLEYECFEALQITYKRK